MKKKILLTLGIAAIMGLAGCGETPAPSPSTPEDPPVVVVDPVVTGITLKAAGDKTSLEVGETLQFTATVTGEGEYNKQVTYSVDKSDVAEISSAGLLTAKGRGTVRVTATSVGDSSKKASLDISVSHSIVTGITLTAEGGATSVEIRKTLKFTAAVTGQDNFNQNYTFSVDKANLASISDEGVLTGKAEGTVRVTATATGDTTKTASLEIAVTAAPVSEIKDATEGAYVHVIGKVTAVGKGCYFVDDGTDALEVYYNGYNGEVPEAIAIGKVVDLAGVIDDYYGTKQLNAVDGKDAYFTWKESDETIGSTLLDGAEKATAAAFDADAETFTALKPIKFHGTATKQYEGYTSDFNFKIDDESTHILHPSYSSDAIKNALSEGVEYDVTGYVAPYHSTNKYNQLYIASLTVATTPRGPQAIAISGGAESIKVGGTTKFNCALSRTDEKLITESGVTWSSSVATVATVDNEGTVTGVAEGTTVITVTSTFDSTVKASVTLTVTPAVAVVSLSDISGKTALPLHFKESDYTATVSYENETQDTSLSWEIVTESMKEKVAIDANGKLTPKENAVFAVGDQIEIKATTTGHTSGNVSLSKSFTVTLRYDGIDESLAENDSSAVYTFAGVVSVYGTGNKAKKYLTDGSRYLLLYSYATGVSDEEKALVVDGAKLVVDTKLTIYNGLYEATQISSIVAKTDLTIEAPQATVKGSDYFNAESYESGVLIQFDAYFDGTGATANAHFETVTAGSLPVSCHSDGKTPGTAYKWYRVTAMTYNEFDTNFKIYAITIDAIEPDPVSPVEPTKVEILNPVQEINVGQIINMKAMVFGSEAAQDVTWSSDSEKATIDASTGVLTGVSTTESNEKVTITAAATADATVFATMEISVLPVVPKALPVGGLTINLSNVPGTSYNANKNTDITIGDFSATLDPNGIGNVTKAGSPYTTGTGKVGVNCIQIKANSGTFLRFNTPISSASNVRITFYSTNVFVSGTPGSGQYSLDKAPSVKKGTTTITPKLETGEDSGVVDGNSKTVYRYEIDYSATITNECLVFNTAIQGAVYIASIVITA